MCQPAGQFCTSLTIGRQDRNKSCDLAMVNIGLLMQVAITAGAVGCALTRFRSPEEDANVFHAA